MRLAALTKGRTAFVSFFSTTALATNGRRHEKVCKELDNACLLKKRCLNHFVCEILTNIIPSFEFSWSAPQSFPAGTLCTAQ